MFDVVPVANVRSESRFCLVCASGSAPVMVVFLKADLLERPEVRAPIKRINDFHQRLQVVIVGLGEANTLRETMKRIEKGEPQFDVPMMILPDDGLPESLRVDPADDSTVLIYRSRQEVRTFRNVDFTTFDPERPGAQDRIKREPSILDQVRYSKRFDAGGVAAGLAEPPVSVGTVGAAVSDMLRGL